MSNDDSSNEERPKTGRRYRTDPALALGIFVALPIAFALTYHRRYY